MSLNSKNCKSEMFFYTLQAYILQHLIEVLLVFSLLFLKNFQFQGSISSTFGGHPLSLISFK